jgi:hypothetical protein
MEMRSPRCGERPSIAGETGAAPTRFALVLRATCHGTNLFGQKGRSTRTLDIPRAPALDRMTASPRAVSRGVRGLPLSGSRVFQLTARGWSPEEIVGVDVVCNAQVSFYC